MLPIRAMPRAVPISRVVSLTALATPCLAAGSELTMALVAGVMARPMPTPRMSWAASSAGYPLPASRVAKATMPAPVRARPAPLTSRMPYRIDSGAADAATGSMRKGTDRERRRPAPDGAFDDAEHEPADAQRRQHRADRVETDVRLRPGGRHEGEDGDEGEGRQGRRGVEDRRPREGPEHPAGGQHAE